MKERTNHSRLCKNRNDTGIENMTIVKNNLIWLLLLATIVLVASSALSMPPNKAAIEKWKAEGVWEQKVANWNAFKAAGGCSPEEHVPFDRAKRKERLALGEEVTDTVHVVVLLAEFTDWPASGGAADGQPDQFDSLLFSEGKHNPTGSMTEFYMENSYGTFFVKGDIYGWYLMPRTYAYYVGDDDGTSKGREVAADAAEIANNAGVDFSQYDNDGDGYCDGLIIVHSGRGAEEGAYGIWSHKSNLSFPYPVYDGVTVKAYTINPEELGNQLSNMGVFAHEYGHVLGLPDLYHMGPEGTPGQGIGRWSMMSTGSWNGNGKSPSHFDAWCKNELGFALYTFLYDTLNMDNVEIPCVEFNPVTFRLQNISAVPSEYWLVENRQQVGFDVGLPGSGLLVYHVDPGAGGNYNSLRYMIAVEEADGNRNLISGSNTGDPGDPFPGSTNNRAFHDLSIPNSRANDYGLTPGVVTGVGLWDISDSDSIMYADLDVQFSRPWIVLSDDIPVVFDDSEHGDGDGRAEAGEIVEFYCGFKNYMRTAYLARLSISCNNPSVSFGQNDAEISDILGHASNVEPIEIILANDLDPMIDTLWLMVTSDSLYGVEGTKEYQSLIPLEFALGGTQVLVVDDEASASDDYDLVYTEALYDLRIASERWSTADSGSPTGSDLSQFRMVFWHTGDATEGILNNTDITAMKDYLDGHGNLLLSTWGGIQDIVDLDSVFMPNYFGAEVTGTELLMPRVLGIAESQLCIGPDDSATFGSGAPYAIVKHLRAVNGGVEALHQSGNPDKIVGISYQDSTEHSAVLLSSPIEFLALISENGFVPAEFLSCVYDFFGAGSGVPTDVNDGRRTVLPRGFDLEQNYPNPFNPVTTISYTIRPTSGLPPQTTLSIFNMLGQEVRTLVDKPQAPGSYTVIWDGTSGSGQPVATGVYFYRLSRGDDATTRKMVLLK